MKVGFPCNLGGCPAGDLSAAVLSLPASPASASKGGRLRSVQMWGGQLVLLSACRVWFVNSHLRQLNEIMSKYPFEGGDGTLTFIFSWMRKLRGPETCFNLPEVERVSEPDRAGFPQISQCFSSASLPGPDVSSSFLSPRRLQAFLKC